MCIQIIYKLKVSLSATSLSGVACFSQPDNIEKIMAAELPPKYLTNLNTFQAALDKEDKFEPFGKMIDAYTLKTS